MEKLYSHWNLASLAKNWRGITETSTPHRSETNGIAERAVRRVKEGTSSALLQSGLDEKWWSDSVECYCHVRNVQDILADGETPHERRFGESFKGPIIPFGALVEYLPSSARDQARIHQIGDRMYYQGFFEDMHWSREDYAKEIFWLPILKNLENLDASDILSQKTECERSPGNSKEMEKLYSLVADGTAKLSGRDYEFPGTHSETWTNRRGARVSEENFSANRKSLNRQKWDDAEGRADFWSIQGDFIYRRHNEPRVGSAHTDLDVMQQKRIDDYWKVDLKRSLSNS